MLMYTRWRSGSLTTSAFYMNSPKIYRARCPLFTCSLVMEHHTCSLKTALLAGLRVQFKVLILVRNLYGSGPQRSPPFKLASVRSWETLNALSSLELRFLGPSLGPTQHPGGRGQPGHVNSAQLWTTAGWWHVVLCGNFRFCNSLPISTFRDQSLLSTWAPCRDCLYMGIRTWCEWEATYLSFDWICKDCPPLESPVSV